MRKGYKSIKLAAAKVGSDKAREKKTSAAGTYQRALEFSGLNGLLVPHQGKDNEGHVDNVRLANIVLSEAVKNLVKEIYDEATNQLTSKIAAKITAEGIESPLGILDEEQISKGEATLGKLERLILDTKSPPVTGDVERLSGEVSAACHL